VGRPAAAAGETGGGLSGGAGGPEPRGEAGPVPGGVVAQRGLLLPAGAPG